jgi:hypothetical protein
MKCDNCEHKAKFIVRGEHRSVLFNTRTHCCGQCLATVIREQWKTHPMRVSVSLVRQ